MILAIDVGNTNTVLGCIEGGEIKHIVRIKTCIGDTFEEYAIKLKQLFDFYGIEQGGFEGAIMSSVVPPVNRPISDAVKSLTGCELMIVDHRTPTGIGINIDDPGTLAGDLLVGGAAASHFYGAPAIIIDMGTATTVTVVDKDNDFRGGVIMPGIRLSLAALASGTSLLPQISISRPEHSIGSNTVDCMRSGAVYGTAATVDGLIDRMENELGYKCTLVATGGLASAVIPQCTHKDIICDDDLLLKGLDYIYHLNK